MKPLVTVPFFIVHAGCPHRCVFCDQRSISGAAGDLPSTADIAGAVASFRAMAGKRPVEVAFFGGSFTSLPLRAQEVLLAAVAPLLERGEVESIRISTRPDSVSPDSAAFVRDRGVRRVEIGVQSMDDGVLRLSGRGHSAADVERAFSVLLSAGLDAAAQLMPGLPGDTLETSRESLRRVLALQPAFLRIYPTLVIAGTELAELYRSGRYAPLSLDEGVAWCKVLLLEALRAGIPVIRVGLQESDLLAASVEAGPYHPAFRQLVESELFFDLIRRFCSSGAVGVRCCPGDLSTVIGQKRRNMARLRQDHGIDASVEADPQIPRWSLELTTAVEVRSASVITDLHYEQGNA